MTRRSHRSIPPVALFVAFCAGMLVHWGLTVFGPPKPAIASEVRLKPDTTGAIRLKPDATDNPAATGTAGNPAAPVASGFSRTSPTIGAVPSQSLRLPIDGDDVNNWKGGFAEHRGSRPHEAIDILAARNTPVHAVDDGTIAKLFFSKAGGITIYQFDPGGRRAYYYAHLERYAPGLHDGQVVSQGDVIGFVGTSGNAPPNTPHLHFGVFELNEDRHWWQGRAIDPYEVFRR
jgi:murein DD-endopeptidase MepM/ murein hydrolase activator NlpD